MKEKDAGRISVVPPNDPLTLNELREMGGEPVWCLEMRCWGIIKLETIGCGQFGKSFVCQLTCHIVLRGLLSRVNLSK